MNKTRASKPVNGSGSGSCCDHAKRGAARSAPLPAREAAELLGSRVTLQPPQSPGRTQPRAGQAAQAQEMRRLLAHLRATLDTSEDALVSVGLDGTIILWNSCAEALFGYSAAEATGRPLSLLIPSDRAGEFTSVLDKVRNGERVEHLETVRVRRDGIHVTVLLSATPVCDDSGAIIGMSATIRDVTEQKRLESEMRLWRDELQAIAGGVDDAVVVRAAANQVVYANDSAARLLGYDSIADLIRNLPSDTHNRLQFHMESGELVPAGELPGLLGLQGVEVPATVLRFHRLADGAERWVTVKAVPIGNGEGQIRYSASIFSDITERKRVEQALKESEARFQAFMDNSPIVAFIKDEQARFVYVNPRFEEAFCTTASALLGRSDTALVSDEIARRIHEDDAEVLSSGRLKQIVEVIPGPDGMPHHWLTLKFPLSLPGGKRCVAGAAVEITDRVRAEEALKESEARFQAFMHNAPIVAFMKDESGKVVFLNHAWEQLFGVPIAEALGKDDYQLQPPDLAQRLHEADMEVLRSGKVKVAPETVTAADGTVRHWVTFKFPIVLPSGARYLGGASVEITERVQAEQDLQQYADRLQTLSRQLIEAQEAERRRISRDLHDQVGQLLTAIKIDLQISQQQVMLGVLAARSHAAETGGFGTQALPAAGAETDGESQPVHVLFAQRLEKGIEMVECTIQEVRQFSLDLRPSILDDLGLPSALLWYTEEQAKRAGFYADLAVEQLPARLSPELEIICFRVAQEAITNVIRHAGASKVSVGLKRDGDTLVLSVADNGAGFDAHALASGIVGESANSGRSRARADDRIRTLGLAGMQERVMLVGGTLSIQSTPGAGTTVRAVFPVGALTRVPAERSKSGKQGR